MPFDHGRDASPFNSLPPVAVVLSLAMVAVELVLELAQQGMVGGAAGVGWRLAALERWAFSGPLLDWALEDGSRLGLPVLVRFVSYPFVHGGFMHMTFSVAILLALGKFAGEVLSGIALAAVWFGSAILAALAYALLTSTMVPLYGAMPADYGLVGAFTFLLWQRARQRGANPLPAFRMIGVLLGLQLFFMLLQSGSGPQILAELAGFAAGFALCFLLAPGGREAVAAWLRRR